MNRLLGFAVVLLVSGLSAPAAAAQAAPAPLDIRIERDSRPRAAAVELGAFHVVTITDRATGQPPAKIYAVFAQASNAAGEETEYFACDHVNTVDSRTPPGVYNCPVFVDHGGTWDLTAIVREPAEDAVGMEGVTPSLVGPDVARASAPFELATDQVYANSDGNSVNTSAATVFLLWLHVSVAAGWFGCAAALAALGLPQLRRRISSFGLNRLERRFDLVMKSTGIATAAVVGTGIFLLLNETAYEMPFSTSSLDSVLVLPYARPYFLALGVKLGLYALMIVAVVQLAGGARRQLHLGAGSARARRDSGPWADPPLTSSGGAVATLTAPAQTTTTSRDAEPPASLLSRISVAVLVVGAAGISLCVTLLKYFHQTIEALP